MASEPFSYAEEFGFADELDPLSTSTSEEKSENDGEYFSYAEEFGFADKEPEPEAPVEEEEEEEEPGFMSRMGDALMSPSVNPVGSALLTGGMDPDEYTEGRTAQAEASLFRNPLGTAAELPTNFARKMLANLTGKSMEDIDISFAGVNLNEVAREQFQKAAALQEEAHAKTPEAPIPEFFTQALDSVVEMGPALMTSYLTKNPNAALSVMGVPIFGRAYGTARSEGKTPHEAMTEGGIALATELIPEKMMGVFDNLVFGKTLKDLVTTSLKEAGSEIITEEWQMQDEVMRQGEEITPTEAWKRRLRAGAMGAVIGVPAAVPSAISNKGKGLAAPAEEELGPVEAAKRAAEELEQSIESVEQEIGEQEARSLEEQQAEMRALVAEQGGDALSQELAAAGVAEEMSAQMAEAALARQAYFERERFEMEERKSRAEAQEKRAAEEEKAYKEREKEQRAIEKQKREDEAQARVEQEIARAEEAAVEEPLQEEVEALAPEGPARGPAMAEALEEAGVQDMDLSTEAGQEQKVVGEVMPTEQTEIELNQAVLEAGHQAASSPTNELVEPAEGAPETAYPVGEVELQGLSLEIENAPGTERNGRLMTQTYGRIKGVKGADNEALDVFVGSNPTSENVFVIDQLNEDGTFDEHKVMIGYKNQLAAVKAYKSNKHESRPMGPVTAMPMEQFKGTIASGALKSPLSSSLSQPRGRKGLQAKRARQGLGDRLRRITLGGGLAAKAKSFIDAFNARTQSNPLNPRQRKSGKVLIELVPHGSTVRIKEIRSIEPGKGHASRELQKLLQEADTAGVTLSLSAKQIGEKGLTTRQLTQWYRRNGFTGRADNMTRKPQTESKAQLRRRPAERAGLPMTLKEARYTAKALLDKLPTIKKVTHIFENYDALPDEVKAKAEREGNAEGMRQGVIPGWLSPDTGQIYILANGNHSTDNLLETILHEGIGHLGLRTFLLNHKKINPDAVLQEIYDSVSKNPTPEFEYVLAMYEKQLGDLSKRDQQLLAADEYAAKLAEKPDADMNTWEKIVDLVHSFLRSIAHDMGWAKEWTRSDVRKLVRQSGKYMRKDRTMEVVNVAAFNRGLLEINTEGVMLLKRNGKDFVPYVPTPEQVHIPNTLIGWTEQDILDIFDRAEKADSEVTSRRLMMAYGAPVGVHGKPTSYPELQRMLNWALENEADIHWYEQFARGLQEIVGRANMHEASFLFGITSPQSPVRNNLRDTLLTMYVARMYNPITNTENFIRTLEMYRDSMESAGFGLTNTNIGKIVKYYKTGEYSSAYMKAITYANTVLAKAKNTFHPYGVMDRHMGRAFGFAKDAFSDRQYRYMNFLTHKLALDNNMRIEEVQAGLWFYAKKNLSTDKSVGTWAEAAEFSKKEIAAIKSMIKKGQFNTRKPLSENTADEPMARFEVMGSTKKPRKVDPYSNHRHEAQIQEVARARAPTILISLEPGHERGYGFPEGMSYKEKERYRDEVLAKITDVDGQLILLRELGIPHEVELTAGTWKNNLEPSLKITLLDGTLETANLVAPLLSHAFLQDAAYTAKPKWGGRDFVGLVSKKDGTEFTFEELNAIMDALEEGLDFSAINNSGALKFIDNAKFENWEGYSDADLQAFADKLTGYFDEETYEILYSNQEGEPFETIEGAPDNAELWNQASAKGSPNIQRTANDWLYKPIWETYRAYNQKLGHTPQNTEAPIKGLKAFDAPVAKDSAPKAATESPMRMRILPGRLRKTIANNPQSGPLRAIAAGAVTMEEALNNSHTVRERVAAVGRGMTESGRAQTLALAPRNYLPEFLAKPDRMPAVKDYVVDAAKMDARVLELLESSSNTSRKWTKWAGKKANTAEARILGELILASTYNEMDVSKPYKPLPKTTRQQDMQRRASYKVLRDYYDGLGGTATGLYKQVKKDFLDLAKMRDQELDAQIARSQASAKAKKGLQQYLRKKFEAGRVRGYYFPLHRNGKYWAAARDQAGGDVVAFAMFEDSALRDQWVDSQRADGHTITEKDMGEKLDTEIQESVHQIDPDFVKKVEAKLGPGSQDLKDQIWQMYLQSLPEVSIRKAYIHRKGTLGFSGDVLRAYAYGMYHGASQQSKLEFAPVLREHLNAMREQADAISGIKGDPDQKWAPNIVNEMGYRHQLAMHPTSSRMASMLTSAGFAWYLGVTPAAAFVNLTQTPIFALPTLAARFNSKQGAISALGKAYKDVLKYKGTMKMGEALTGRDAAAWKEMSRRGVFQQTRGHDLIGLSQEGVEHSENTKRTMEIISYLFHGAEVINRGVTGIAAYRMAIKAGRSQEAAIEEAIELVEKSHFNYGVTNRPPIMQHGFGKVATLFRQYSLSATWRLVMDFQWGYVRKQRTPAERKEARTRFAGLMMMTAVHAGVHGLPLYSVMKSILNAVFDEDEEDFDAEAAMWDWISEQTDPKFSQLLRKGAWDTITGTSISSRVSLNNLWVREGNERDEGVTALRYYLSQAAGPVWGMVESVGRGTNQIARGNMQGFEKLIPKFISDQLKAIRLTREGALTGRDKAVLVPREDFEIWELAGQSLGLAPSDLVERYEANRVIKDMEMKMQRRRTRLLEKLYLASRNGDGKTVRKTMARVAEFNKHHPTKQIDAKTILRSSQQRYDRLARARHGITVDKDLLYLYHMYDRTTQSRVMGDDSE